MELQDVVVGAVSACFGIFLTAGATLNGRWLMELGRPKLLAVAIGPAAARITLALLGIGLIALGVVIALGWRFQWS